MTGYYTIKGETKMGAYVVDISDGNASKNEREQ